MIASKKQKIDYVLVYNRMNKLNRLGTALVQIRAYQNPSCRYLSTNIYIEPEYWDDKKGKIKPTHPNEFVYTEQIREQLKAIRAFENRMVNRHGSFPLERIHEYKQPDSHFKTFTDFYLYEVECQPKISTKKSQKSRLANLVEFRSGKIYFEDLTYSFIKKFDRFLRAKYDTKKSTIPNIHKTVKSYVRRAIKEDLVSIDKDPYKKFKINAVRVDKVYLTEQELIRIESIKFTKENQFLEKIRDFFLLCCYTGLRYGDVSRLAPEHLLKTNLGWEIRIVTQKTNDLAIIPISDVFLDANGKSKAMTLIEKLQASRKGLNEHFKDVPYIDLKCQYVNRKLKEVAPIAGIEKNITTHVGRHTNATILCTKIPIPVLQRMLTHSSIDTTMQYIHMNGDLIRNELKKVKW